jgi:hypothetical protein
MTSAALPSTPPTLLYLPQFLLRFAFHFLTPVTSERLQDVDSPHNGNLFFDDEKEFDQRPEGNFVYYNSNISWNQTQ